MRGKFRDLVSAEIGSDVPLETLLPRRKIIVAIGIDEYRSLPRLRCAVSDACRVQEVLVRSFGFEAPVAPLTNQAATKRAIEALVEDDLPKLLTTDDALIFFFAGHGTTRLALLGGVTVEAGYLVPVEASGANVFSEFVDMEQLLRKIGMLPAHHILVILDACHSGMALGSSVVQYRTVGAFVHRLAAHRSRRVITSARRDEPALDSGPVPGHSLFTGALIRALTSGQADLDQNGVITFSELALCLQQWVGQASGSRQLPDYGAFHLDDRGELVLAMRHGAPGHATWGPAQVHGRLPKARPSRRWWGIAAAVAGVCALAGLGIALGDNLLPDSTRKPSLPASATASAASALGGKDVGKDSQAAFQHEAEMTEAPRSPAERLRHSYLLGFRLSLAARLRASNLASPERAEEVIGKQLKRVNRYGKFLGFMRPIALSSPKPGEDKTAYMNRCVDDAGQLGKELGERHGVGPKSAFQLAFEVGIGPELGRLDEPTRLDMLDRYTQYLRALGMSNASLRILEQGLKVNDKDKATDAVFAFKTEVTDALHERVAGTVWCKQRELDTWLYANNASTIAAVYSTGKLGPTDMPDLVRKSNAAAQRLGLVVPELPPREGDNVKDTAKVLHYMLKTLGSANVDEVHEHFGPDAKAILEMAVKLHVLLIMYGPGDSSTEAAMSAITRTCRAVSLPEDVWMPLVRRIERREKFDTAKSQIFTFKQRFEEHLEWRVDVAKQSGDPATHAPR